MRHAVFAAAALALLPLPGWAQMSEAEVFLTLCVDAGFSPLSGIPPSGFPDAVRLPDGAVLPGIGATLPIQVVEAWDLVPDRTAGDRAALVVGLLDHPNLGQMAVCTILYRWARTVDLHAGLVEAGAEEDQGIFFLESGGRAWMITATGMPENPSGEGIIMGMTRNGAGP